MITDTQIEEHFAFRVNDDKGRLSRLAGRTGRTSPTHSAHGILMRHSLLKVSEGKKAKKVRFYRNGDRFFKGMIFAVSPERFRTFESLLAELTTSPICDKNILPNGVRHIFALDSGRKITSVEQLQEGENYVCASIDVLRQTEYLKGTNPSWNCNVRSHDSTEGLPLSSRDTASLDMKDYIKPKLITIIRNGTKPRKAMRVLLNKKTAHSFDQVMDDITEAIKLDSGAVKKIFTIDGRQVTCLSDFFQDDSMFIAYGPEKYSVDDFGLDENEVKLVSAYKASAFSPNKQIGQRVTLRSPKSPRRLYSSSSSRSLNDVGLDRQASSSPKSPRKRPVAPRKKLINGGSSFDYTDKIGPPELTQKYNIGKIIGDGNFAAVRECLDRDSKTTYALKIIDKCKCLGKEQMIENEVSILKQVKHPNIILLVDDFETPDHLYLVMELVNGGDLFDAIATSTKYTERDASGMVFNLSSALKYLHSLNILHRDIKPENILVCEHTDGTKSLKLGDFGLATYATETLFTVCGTPTYVAPEVLAESGYGLQIDVWSAGVITYILLCGFPPFVSAEINETELFDKILSGKFEFTSPYWDDISDSAKELISGMLALDPKKRFSSADVVNHPWVADDTAKDQDLIKVISKKLRSNFVPRSKNMNFRTAGVRVIACTALDKGSRYFEGPKGGSLTIHSRGGEHDEVF